MSSILENLIRTYLIEGRTVAKLRGVSAKETAEARAAGAVHAYAVLVKGTSTPSTIIDLVEAATAASSGAETDSTISVGKRSKFANGDYVYVMSDPLPKNRQTITVWILKNPFLLSTTSDQELVNSFTSPARNFIGNAALFTMSAYNQEIKKLDVNVTPITDLKSKETALDQTKDKIKDLVAGDKDVIEKIITRNGKKIGTFTGIVNSNERPIEGLMAYDDGTWDAGMWDVKTGSLISGTKNSYVYNNAGKPVSTFKGEIKNGVPSDSANQKLTDLATNEYFEGSINSSYIPVNGTLYSDSTKNVEIGKYVNGSFEAKEIYTNQQIIDATKSSKYSDASKYFQQLMVDKIATQPKIVTSAGELYTKVKNNIDGRWGNDSKNLTKFMLAVFELDQNSGVTDQFIKRINGLNKEIIESILHIKTAVLEQINLDAGIKAKEQILATTPTPNPKPTPTPSPKPIPTPKPQPTPQKDSISKDVYILKKNHDISYIDGSANSFLQNMKKWVTGSHRSIGQAATTIFQDSNRGKWFTRKSITIPKGTKVYIHPDKVVMLVNDPQGTPDGNTWRIIYQFGTKTLSTSSYANLWKSLWKTYIAYPKFQDLADSLDIDNIVYSTPKYRNDELVGFLRTLDPKVQSKQELVKNLSKKQKEQLNKQFDMCIQIAKDFYEIFGKNPETYFGKYKGSALIPGDQDLKGALIYLQDAVKDAYIKEFKLLSTSTNKDIRDNAKKLHDVYVSVQEYLRDLIRSGSSQRDMLFKFKLIHPFDSKKNTNVTIRFDYL
jgi:hypothetical protein